MTFPPRMTPHTNYDASCGMAFTNNSQLEEDHQILRQRLREAAILLEDAGLGEYGHFDPKIRAFLDTLPTDLKE